MLSEKPKNDTKRSKNLVIASGIVVLVGMIFPVVLMLMPTLFPTGLDIDDVQGMDIRTSWTGLSRISPIHADYDLVMTDGTLQGTATFSITSDSITETVDIIIPADVVTAFFDTFETVTMRQGEYTPYFAWTDDYPYAEITIMTDSDTYLIYSGSQGEKNIPWGATIDGTDFTIDSGIPAEALAILEPHLRLDVQDDLISSYNNSK